MGKKKSAPAPKTTYTPPPPPPTIVQTPTQAVRTESALSEVAQAQQRLNMELGSQLDRTNEEFFAGQDIRRTQAVGAETRLGQRVAGEEERAGIRVTGEESRFGQRVAGQEERAGIRTTGREQRETIGKTGTETRTTDLQQEMFRRYKENRDYEQAQQQYRS
jgi:hypothetical protein